MKPFKHGRYGRMINFEKYPEGSLGPFVILPSGKTVEADSTEQAGSIVRAVNCHDELVEWQLWILYSTHVF